MDPADLQVCRVPAISQAEELIAWTLTRHLASPPRGGSGVAAGRLGPLRSPEILRSRSVEVGVIEAHGRWVGPAHRRLRSVENCRSVAPVEDVTVVPHRHHRADLVER